MSLRQAFKVAIGEGALIITVHHHLFPTNPIITDTLFREMVVTTISWQYTFLSSISKLTLQSSNCPLAMLSPRNVQPLCSKLHLIKVNRVKNTSRASRTNNKAQPLQFLADEALPALNN